MTDAQSNDDTAAIEVELTFHGSPPTALLVSTIQVCEEEIYQSQRAELEAALEHVGDLPGYVKSVCRRRFADTSCVSLRFTDSRHGSIVLLGALTALGYWIIQHTVGETIKDAYKETGMHDKLKQFLLSRYRRQADELGSALAGRLVRFTSDAPTQVSVNTIGRDARSVVSIVVTMSGEREQSLPPTIYAWLRSDG